MSSRTIPIDPDDPKGLQATITASVEEAGIGQEDIIVWRAKLLGFNSARYTDLRLQSCSTAQATLDYACEAVEQEDKRVAFIREELDGLV